MNLLRGPIDNKRMGRVTCCWSLSTDPTEWEPEKDCPNEANHHIRWQDNTMSLVCTDHLHQIIEMLQTSEISNTFAIHKFRQQCSQEGAVWLMPANICTNPHNNGGVTWHG